jgi:4-amino-4-deoxy-L-arabinose transferase-like glycosyltransferase
LHNDVAVNALDILNTIPRLHPIFFELNNGREPLFIYLQALIAAAIGLTPFSLRLTSAMIGVLTVTATYRLGCSWFGPRAGFFAGLGLATSFWHVDLSRFGLRAIAAPLFVVVALVFLTRALRWGGLASFALAGLAIALDLYTYTSARMLPFLVIGILAWEALRGRRQLSRRMTGLAVTLAVVVVLVAPLGAYFARHPEFLVERASQVSIFNPNPAIESSPVSFEVNAERTLGMFFVAGDQNPRQNLPGRPVFDLVAAPFLLV